MKTLYLQCNMGIAGDMLAGALYELLEDQRGFLEIANRLSPQITVEAVPSVKQGISGTRLCVRINGVEEEQGVHGHPGHHHGEEQGVHDHSGHHGEGHHHHSDLSQIHGILSALPVSDSVKERAHQVYHALADAEANAHGCPVDQIHFHEVGELDAVADITLACLALEMLGVEQVICSPICTGFGQVRCAHGILPVPAPATAFLLKGLPVYAGEVEGELTTPTGAALAKTLSHRFAQMPPMQVEKIGYGMGGKDFPGAANCLRAFFGQSEGGVNKVTELVCSIDDMTPEEMGFATRRLMEQGALDVTVVPALMKKGRPGFLMTVLASSEQEESLADAVLRETTTNGLRMRRCERRILTASIETQMTGLGPVRVKKAASGDTVHRKPEYEDVAAAAEREGLSFREANVQILQDL